MGTYEGNSNGGRGESDIIKLIDLHLLYHIFISFSYFQNEVSIKI